MSEEKKIEVGSVVTLNSGGPEMTVYELNGVDFATCVWFSRHQGINPGDVTFGVHNTAQFPVNTLMLVS